MSNSRVFVGENITALEMFLLALFTYEPHNFISVHSFVPSVEIHLVSCYSTMHFLFACGCQLDLTFLGSGAVCLSRVLSVVICIASFSEPNLDC